jgi:Ca2+/Na+ antiporter
MGFAVLGLIGITITVFKDRTIPYREGAMMAALLLASVGLQLKMGDRYIANLNTLSLLCMVAFWVIYSRNLSARINKRIAENRLKRKL